MTIRRCILCVLCAFVLSSALFSTSAYALEPVTGSSLKLNVNQNKLFTLRTDETIQPFSLQDDDDTNGMILVKYRHGYYNRTNATAWYDNKVEFTSGNGISAWDQIELTNNKITALDGNNDFYDFYHFSKTDSTSMYDQNAKGTITLSGLYTKFTISQIFNSSFVSTKDYYPKDYSGATIVLKLMRADGSVIQTYHDYEGCTITPAGSTFNLSVDIPVVEEDVYSLQVSIRYNLLSNFGLPNDFYSVSKDLETGAIINGYVGYLRHGIEDGDLIATYDDGEVTGMLGGIIEWVKGIYNSIIQLPQKIGVTITDGIKSLFVPSEEVMVGIKEDWDELLASRFGAVYEAGTIMIEFASGLTETAEQEYIEFPKVSYSFSGVPFEFGGWNVDIVPDQFNWLAEVLKGVLDIVCTLAFLNTLRKKYDEMVG